MDLIILIKIWPCKNFYFWNPTLPKLAKSVLCHAPTLSYVDIRCQRMKKILAGLDISCKS